MTKVQARMMRALEELARLARSGDAVITKVLTTPPLNGFQQSGQIVIMFEGTAGRTRRRA